MNVLLCVKQVPDTTEIRIDPVNNTLIRDGVSSILNPFDGFALEAAARIKDEDPDCRIIAMAMGPESAKKALKECLAIAADKAYLISARAFGGSDTLATSYILYNAVKKLESIEGKFDLIFCGKQAIDGDTAQVGPELAEYLGYPQVTCALECKLYGSSLEVLQEGDVNRVIGVDLPCLVTFTKPNFALRYPTLKRRIASNRAEIPVFTDEDFEDIDRLHIGLKGSPTKVKKTFVPRKKTGGMIVDEGSAEANAAKLAHLLHEAHII